MRCFIGAVYAPSQLQGITLHVLSQSILILFLEILGKLRNLQNELLSIPVNRQVII